MNLTIKEIANTGNKQSMKELILGMNEGAEKVLMTADGEYAVLVREEEGARLHVEQEDKPNWDIVIYYDEDGSISGEGVKPTIINTK